MTKLFETNTRLEAWIAATDYLLGVHPTLGVRSALNVTLSIASPVTDGPAASAAAARIDDFLGSEGESPLHSVAETIFPGWEYKRRGSFGVFQTYPDQEYPYLKAADPTRWGTYAYRLVRRPNASGELINPLENLIGKMRTEAQTPGPKKSCYELGIAEGPYDIALYDTVGDEWRHMGGPCLSHLSFKYFEKRVHLAAFYRSHCYRYKVIGNLLGLARLLAFVSKEVGAPVGTLVVHSSYAFLKKDKGRVAELIRDLNLLIAPKEVRNELVG